MGPPAGTYVAYEALQEAHVATASRILGLYRPYVTGRKARISRFRSRSNLAGRPDRAKKGRRSPNERRRLPYLACVLPSASLLRPICVGPVLLSGTSLENFTLHPARLTTEDVK